MKKKLILLLSIFTFILVLVGCVDTGTQDTSSTTASNPTTVTTVTTNTTVTTVFHREDLVNFFAEQSGIELDQEGAAEAIDAQIGIILSITGIETEAELYQLITNAQTIYESTGAIETFADFQAWYQNAKSLGFNEETITLLASNSLLGFINFYLSEFDSASVEAAIQEYQDELDDLNGSLADLLDQQDNMRVAVVAYASAFSEPVRTNIVNLYDAYLMTDQYENDYYDAISEAFYNEYFDYYTYFDLEYYLEEYIYYTYEVTNSDDPAIYMGLYNTALSQLDPMVQLTYEYVCQAYLDYQEYTYEVLYATMDLFDGVINPLTGEYVSYEISNYYDEYQYISMDIEDLYYSIESTQYSLDNYMADLENLDYINIAKEYLMSASGSATVTAMIAMLYDTVDYVATNLSQSSFDFIVTLMNQEEAPLNPDMSSLEIVAFITQVRQLLVLLDSSFDSADQATLIQFGQDFAELYIPTLELDPTEEAALISTIQTAIASYVTSTDAVITELLDFLNTISVQKVDAIMNIVNISNQIDPSNNAIAIAVANAIDTVLGDDSLDFDLVVGFVVDGAFDAQSMFDPDEVAKAELKADILDSIQTILADSYLIKGYDENNLTSDQLTNIQNFMSDVSDLMNLVNNLNVLPVK